MLLDILLLVIGLLFFAMGSRRGVVREVFVTAGLLSGAMLSLSWSRPWGEDAAELFRLSPDSGRFLVSLGFIIGMTLIIGYGGPMATDLDGGFVTRWAAGALLGFYNGALLVGFVLRDIERYLADEATMRMLQQSRIAWFLLRQSGWIFFSAALLFSCATIWSVYRARSEARFAPSPVLRQSTASRQLHLQTSRKSPRLRWGHDGDKVEPVNSGSGTLSAGLSSSNGNYAYTVPIAPVDETLWADRLQATQTSGPDWLEIASARDFERASDMTRPREVSHAPALTRCSSCGERLGSEEIYCPRCGRADSSR